MITPKGAQRLLDRLKNGTSRQLDSHDGVIALEFFTQSRHDVSRAFHFWPSIASQPFADLGNDTDIQIAEKPREPRKPRHRKHSNSKPTLSSSIFFKPGGVEGRLKISQTLEDLY